jgi:hypothetical protein
MPEGSTVLPAILTLLGPRIVPDTAATRPLVHSAIPERFALGGADMAYVLGNDRARAYLADDLKKFPALDAGLLAARKVLADAPRTDDLYTAWLDAIRGLAARPEGALPSFMNGEPFADLRLNSTVAAFAQLRHNYVLIAAQSYDEGGCDIPDGYVEPALATYDALIHYAERGAAVFRELGAPDAYFAQVATVLKSLRAIVWIELAGQPLPKDAQRFLSQVVEMTPGSTGSAPTYTGWYFDLFPKRWEDGLKGADLIADFYTSSNAGISYLGTTAPRIGVFVVDAGGAPRAVVGPVARAYEAHGPIDGRLNDETAQKLPDKQRLDPWARSYTIAGPPPPDLSVSYGEEGGGVTVESAGSLGDVTVELLDHHREVIHKVTKKITGRGKNVFTFQDTKVDIEGIHVQIGWWNAWIDVHMVCNCASFASGSFSE